MKVPNFTLFSHEKNEVSLSDFKGQHTLINFFPQAFTSVCTDQLCNMRDNLNNYKKLGVNVIGISVDSPFTLDAFAKSENYNFPLLSDFNKNTTRAYDVYMEDFAFGMKGVSKRAVILINKDGEEVYREVTASPGDAPNFDKLAAAVAQLSQ